jgi:hypothetical protein
MAATRGWLLRTPGIAFGLRRPRRDALDLGLERDETWSGEVRAPWVEVRCLQGTVWVTVEGDVEDRVLAAGESFVRARPGRVAMMALAPARVRVRGFSEDRRAALPARTTSTAA